MQSNNDEKKCGNRLDDMAITYEQGLKLCGCGKEYSCNFKKGYNAALQAVKKEFCQPQNEAKGRKREVRAWAYVGSHGGIFEFAMGPVAEKYPKLMHIYSEKVTNDLIPITIIYDNPSNH